MTFTLIDCLLHKIGAWVAVTQLIREIFAKAGSEEKVIKTSTNELRNQGLFEIGSVSQELDSHPYQAI